MVYERIIFFSALLLVFDVTYGERSLCLGKVGILVKGWDFGQRMKIVIQVQKFGLDV